MLRNARSLGVPVVTLVPLTALLVGNIAQQYDDSNKVVYAKQRLRKECDTFEREKTRDESGLKQTGASAWLGNAAHKFPYLLSVSAGDNPAAVTNKLLEGAHVLGSYEERTCDTLTRLTAPTSALGLAIHRTAAQYTALKTLLHENVLADFDPRAQVRMQAEGVMMDALLYALRDMQCSKQRSHDGSNGSDANPLAHSQTSEATGCPVFLLRDFDALSDLDAEKWLRWTHQISSEGLAHVVLLTTATVTPSKAQWLQTRHQNALSAAYLDGTQDFVCILLRPANGLVDDTSAEEKLREIAKSHNLRLFPELSPASNDCQDDSNKTDSKRSAEIEIILEATGNWWSDIDVICRRLKENKLNAVTLPETRLALTQKLCNDFVDDIEMVLLESLHLGESLQLPYKVGPSHIFESSFSADSDGTNDAFDTSNVLTTLEAWKCLETLVDVVPIFGGTSLVGAPQQLLDQKDKAPLNCVSPVNALLPFHCRKDGEQKFWDLIDQQLLFLRPKDAVKVGVIPCETAALVSPCLIQIRPVVKKAFEKIHKSDTYFRAILDVDRFAANIEMRKEIEQYEQEIAERQKASLDAKRDFAILQFSMTPAQKAQRKAELALIDVELQAKYVYLEKLRSLQTR